MVKLYKIAKNNWRLLCAAVIMQIIIFFNNVLIIDTVSRMTDYSYDKDFYGLKKSLIMLAALFTLLLITTIIKQTEIKKFSEYSYYDLKENLFSRINNGKYNSVKKNSNGDYITIFSNEIETIKNYLENDYLRMLTITFEFLIPFVYLLTINVKLAVFILLPTPFLMLILNKIVKNIEKVSKSKYEQISVINSNAKDILEGNSVIKSYNLHQIMGNKTKEETDKLVKIDLKNYKFICSCISISHILEFIPLIIVIIVGGNLMISSNLSFAYIYAFISLVNKISFSLRDIPDILVKYKTVCSAIGRLNIILEIEQEEPYDETFNIKNADISISIKNVSFSYDQEKKVFDLLNLDINSRTKNAIVGKSGIGKSTLFNLLLGFESPDEGSISIMGNTITDYNIRNIRDIISVVTQDTFLFNESIRYNITMGSDEYSEEEIIRAAQISNAHEFVTLLDEGYDTIVKENGANFSGGQRQRISLARAILRNRPILLLDEVTSALDEANENYILTKLTQEQDKTVVLISHRKKAIDKMNNIIGIKNGNIDFVKINEGVKA